MTTKAIEVILLITAVLAVVSATTTFTNVASADTCIDNYGGQYSSAISYPLYRGSRIPLVKFDLTGVPADAYVLSAQLNITFLDYGTDWG